MMHVCIKRSGLLWGLLLFFLCCTPVQAEVLHVAVASNFTEPMKQLVTNFEKESGHDLRVTFGASGKFYAQIKQGAPFQVFLSADQDKPERLQQEGLILADSRFTYAQGALVLWSAKPSFVDAKGQVLKQKNFKHLALANPKLAPYGLAAIDVLNKMGLKKQLQAQFVQGENIAQTYQFVASGNAELGFVALSQVMRAGKITKGSAWVIPKSFYRPIRQDAVILARAKNNTAARAFFTYLHSQEAQKIIQAYGYQIQG